MSQVEYLETLIENILSLNNNLRIQSESQLKNLSETNPEIYIQSLLSLLQDSKSSKIRGFCAISLRKHLSKNNLWSKLSVSSLDQIKILLFKAIQSENDSSNRHQICDAIGEIAGNIDNSFPEIVPLIKCLFESGKENEIEGGFKILTRLFEFSTSFFDENIHDLQKLFRDGLQNERPIIVLAALETLSVYVSNVASNQAKMFEQFIEMQLKSTCILIENYPEMGENALKYIETIAESEPKFYRKSFPLIFSSMSNIFFDKDKIQIGLKKIATEVLMALAERIPHLYRSNPVLLVSLVQILFCHMTEVSSKITENWSSPEEGFMADIENDSEYENIIFGMQSLDKLINSVGQKQVLPIISNFCESLFQQTDWRCKHAAIMALSQVGEYLYENIEEIKPIIGLVFKYFDDLNPKIRYSVCHCIGQIADDMKPEFQNLYQDIILPKLILCLEDNVPRVQGHAAAAITNFVEGMKKESIKGYLTNLLTILYGLIKNGISIVKENVISALAATAQTAQDEFKAYYKEFVSLLVEILQKYEDFCYRMMKGIIIECLTVITEVIGKELSRDYIFNLIELMIKMQDNLGDGTDPLRNYLLSGWHRLCVVLKLDLLPYMPRLMPKFCSIIPQILSKEIDTEEENPPELSEIMTALNMISIFIKELGHNLTIYIPAITQIILPLISYQLSDEVRKVAVHILPSLFQSFLNAYPQNIDSTQFFKQIYYVLWETISIESEPDLLKEQLISIKNCIDLQGKCFDLSELNETNKRIIKLIYDSDSRKEQLRLSTLSDIDIDEKQLLAIRITLEEDLQIAIAQLIGILLKTHGEMMVKIAILLFEEVALKTCDQGLPAKMQKFGLLLIDDMLEYLGKKPFENNLNRISDILNYFSLSNDIIVREVAIYGLGVFSNALDEEFILYKDKIIDSLLKALKIGEFTESKRIGKFCLHCKDNIIVSIGKILKNKWKFLDNPYLLSEIWMQNLPLKIDKIEAEVQNDLLCDFLINESDKFIQNENFVKETFRIFNDIIYDKSFSQKIKNKMKIFLQKINSNNLDINLMNQFSDLNKIIVEDCLILQ